MAKFCENEFEQAVLEKFENNSWEYLCGYDISRELDSPILKQDLRTYLDQNYDSLSDNEFDQVVSYITEYSNQSLYRALKETYKRLFKGFDLLRDDGSRLFINFFDFGDDAETNNIFRVVNQFEFQEYKLQRPDIVLFINGIPVSVIELKNPADDSVTIADAYEQTHIRYAQNIPSLMKFDFINVISDGANNKYGALFSPYEFYFKWKLKEGDTYRNADGPQGIDNIIEGIFERRTLLNFLRNYIYIPDNSDKNLVILPKYYQYYGAEAMFNGIVKEYAANTHKGGTFWGATGCGKSYIMLFLAKKITTYEDFDKPTVIMLTDRNDLDDQLSEDFENAKEYFVEANTLQIKNRPMLTQKLKDVQSGGVYLMTIQKFREDLNLLSDRRNIFCISDEAHRTQTNVNSKIVMSQAKGAKTVYGFAKYLRDSFPNATYIGFTGTPVDATLQVFGDITFKYTMFQSKEDGATVQISRLNGPREVQLNERQAEICDKFYESMANAGTNPDQIQQSQRDMLKIKTILGATSRLDIVVNHFIGHYEKRCRENATVNGKAMFVCYDREIGLEVYKRIKTLRPEWFEKRKCAPEYDGNEISRDAMDIEKVKFVCSGSKNDTAEMKAIIGTDDDRKNYAKEFKNEKSNFKIVILVDMWITGFDVPSLDTMYLDKPVERHNLIQTISRVNRVFKGKEYGLIVDYIGLESSIAKAMKLYNGDIKPVNGTDAALVIFKDFLQKTMDLMNDVDYSRFFEKTATPLERLNIINKGVEFVMAYKERRDRFTGFTQRAKKAFDVCIGHDQITEHEVDLLHYFLCVRSVIFKMTIGDTPDATLMNKKIAELVDKAICSSYEGKDFTFDDSAKDDVQNLFSDEFLEKLKKIKFPNTKYFALVKLLKRAIKEFGKTNMLKAAEFSKRLKNIIDRYNSRNELSEVQEIIEETIDNLSEELEKVFKDLKKEKSSFEEMGISYIEKAFYDILVAVADEHNFRKALNEETYIELARKIRELVNGKAKYADWTNRQDIRDELYSDLAVLLRKNGYPPTVIDEAYDEVLKQVENFKKYEE